MMQSYKKKTLKHGIIIIEFDEGAIEIQRRPLGVIVISPMERAEFLHAMREMK